MHFKRCYVFFCFLSRLHTLTHGTCYAPHGLQRQPRAHTTA
uniref:Uncharacterized protein n=1 Tax=Arundo donax TaxID=35708 RepID=A0A0A8ZZ44_ARUDO